MNTNHHASSPSTAKRSRFVLSRRNQKGQVAIFVALIFQVLFVFFALLINVGLLVHHKINLQQSADLSAYYGAMKQAEILNTMAHVNFQIRQAFKLLTWRYRVLGTFGFKNGGGTSQTFPIQFGAGNAFTYVGYGGDEANNGPGGMRCNLGGALPLGIQDIPFFCVSHAGFVGWTASESLCNVDCGTFNLGRSVPRVSRAGITFTPFGGTISASINDAITQANAQLQGLCMQLGPIGARMLSRFVAGYVFETTPRIRTMEMLARDLSLPADQMVDIEGEFIDKGTRATFHNNLTEANRTSYEADISVFQAKNGLDNQQCKFIDGRQGGTEFLKKVEIGYLNYFLHNCTGGAGNDSPSNYKPESVYLPSGGLGTPFDTVDASVRDVMQSLLTPGQGHTLGYEKNPHCMAYYAVKATSTPMIPFLPLNKVKLSAVSVAKPFGGSVGPWYGKTWPMGSAHSDYTDSVPATKTDENSPLIDPAAVATDIASSITSQPNYSLFVGDKLGLRDVQYLGVNHAMMIKRDIKVFGASGYVTNNNGPSGLTNTAGSWPDYNDWNGIDNPSAVDFRSYDTLARPTSGMRALEIAAIAPNQFDITHYSIEPDFYHNYYKKLVKGFQKLRAAAGGTLGFLDSPSKIRADFGAVGVDDSGPDVSATPFDPKLFSVKDQILVKNTIFDTSPTIGNAPSGTYNQLFNFLISLQSSVLTSWTFTQFDNYEKFPDGEVNVTDNTMAFGRCLDTWNFTQAAQMNPRDAANFRTPMDETSTLPPTAGNCVTGGRTGYSVKIITPTLVRDNPDIINPTDDSFFTF